MTSGMVELAKRVYSIKEETLVEARYKAAGVAARHILNQGKYLVFSPVSHGYSIKPSSWEEWESFDTRVIKNLIDVVGVLEIEGCYQSTGVTAEIRLALELKKEVIPITPEEVGLKKGYPYQ